MVSNQERNWRGQTDKNKESFSVKLLEKKFQCIIILQNLRCLHNKYDTGE